MKTCVMMHQRRVYFAFVRTCLPIIRALFMVELSAISMPMTHRTCNGQSQAFSLMSKRVSFSRAKKVENTL